MSEELHEKRISSSKFTEGQRNTAVKYFLEHGRCVSRTSVYNWSWQIFGKGNLPMKQDRSDPDEKTSDELKTDNEHLKKRS